MKPGIRINILGASGTGKTTLGRAIAWELGLPFFDSDDYFHFPTDPPFQKQRTGEERRDLLQRDLGPLSSWVLSGGAGTWLPRPELEFTLVVFLRLPADLRISRLREREARLYGTRIAAGGDMETTHREFLEWTSGYDDGSCGGTNSFPAHERFLQELECPLLRMEEALSTGSQVERVLGALRAEGQAFLRRARADDARAIHDSHMRSIRENCAGDYRPEEIAAWGGRPFNASQRLHDIVHDAVWVVDFGGQVQGHGRMSMEEREGERVAYLKELYLAPELKGMGFGYRIMQLMLEAARGAAVGKMVLESTVTAHDFYRRLGFLDSGPELHYQVAGVGVRCFPMALELSGGRAITGGKPS
jgi:adenylate kinase family enzyme/predicted N-acetyltransferase YhbS